MKMFLIKKVKDFILNNRRRIYSKIVKKSIDLSNISIISMNCIGGVLYHDCGAKFLSPTVNLYFLPSDFIKFVNNLEYYLSFTPKIKMSGKYPIGNLDDITIYFMHYTSCEEALRKWEERKQRVNFERIFIIMVERDGFSKEDFENFKKIKYPKFLFTKTREYKCDFSFYMSKYRKLDQIPDLIPGRHMYDKMRLLKELNKVNEVNG